ncbi:NADH dehydrogenase [hydrothermal vent metagenome]|uniref:NADH dehydrogenase n=1 Tax=hydrothermal vent metagenome TaxID=652676 RepID=A0A3B0WAL1_9ZZZZ
MFIPYEDAKRLIKEHSAQLVDVRTPEEFENNKLPGAINIPLQSIDYMGVHKLKKEWPVVVFCRSGQRSHMAMQILISQGFKEVHNLGSYKAWNECPD